MLGLIPIAFIAPKDVLVSIMLVIKHTARKGKDEQAGPELTAYFPLQPFLFA